MCGFDAVSSQPDPSLHPDFAVADRPIQPWWGDRGGGWLRGGCSSCKVPFSTLARDARTTPFNLDKPVWWDSGRQWQTCSLDGCHSPVLMIRTGQIGSKPLSVLILSFPTRRHDLGPISWCGGPAGSSVSRQPLVWSRDHNSRHVTTHRAAGPHQTAPQSSLLHLHSSRLTTQNCAIKIFAVQKTGRGLLCPLPTSIWSKHCHLFHVGPDAALQLGGGGPCGACAVRAFQL